MGAYIPFIVWLAGIAVCALIAYYRKIRTNLFWRVFVIFLGPLAMPFMFFIRPDPDVRSDR